MFLVGLTGGIAAGKTTVANCWESLGAYIVDADVLAREVVRPRSAALLELQAHFGEEIVDSHGELRRDALAEKIFSSVAERKFVESVLHPKIKSLALERISEVPANAIVVYVIPLLVETNSDVAFDFVVTVEAPESEQVDRLVSSRGHTRSSALNRIRSQATAAQRANRADLILNSNQSLQLLLKDAESVWRQIAALAETKNSHK